MSDEPFLPFDDPDFDRALDDVIATTARVFPLLTQAVESDRMLAMVEAIRRGQEELTAGLGAETAANLTILLAFIQGYRTARGQRG